MNLLVCVPTYNEAENIAPFIHAVFEHTPPETDILVVDDSSPDGTADIVQTLIPAYNNRLHILKRPGKQGGASAFLQAFAWGIAGNYDAMLAMDADFSHDPKYIPLLLAKALDYDVVLGSRLARQGKIENRSPIRNLISIAASLYCRILLMAPIIDWTGGFNVWSKTALLKIDIPSIVTRGYSFQIEMKYKAFRARCKIIEVPIVFPDRIRGVSKMPASYFIRALLDVWRIKFYFIKNIAVKQLFKFMITGGLGTITNLLLFFALADAAGLPAIPVSISCFVIAGTQNYILHHRWSFHEATKDTKPSLKQWALFLCFGLAGLCANISVMQMMINAMELRYKVIAQAGGIAAGLIFNFIVSKLVVFRKKKERSVI